MLDGRASRVRFLAVVISGIAGCPGSAAPTDAATDAPPAAAVDSAWCSAVTCGRLYELCHAGLCDLTMPQPACLDTTRGVCSTYVCTIPCGDAGSDVGP